MVGNDAKSDTWKECAPPSGLIVIDRGEQQFIPVNRRSPSISLEDHLKKYQNRTALECVFCVLVLRFVIDYWTEYD